LFLNALFLDFEDGLFDVKTDVDVISEIKYISQGINNSINNHIDIFVISYLQVKAENIILHNNIIIIICIILICMPNNYVYYFVILNHCPMISYYKLVVKEV